MWYKNDIWCDSETDTDEDELPDYMELMLGTNINGTDSDSDGLPDYYESHIPIYNGGYMMTNTTLRDTDGDSLADGEEILISRQYIPMTNNVRVTAIMRSDPRDEDSDGDGLLDGGCRYKAGKVVLPSDDKPMQKHRLSDVIKEHYLSIDTNTISTEYISDERFEVDNIVDDSLYGINSIIGSYAPGLSITRNQIVNDLVNFSLTIKGKDKFQSYFLSEILHGIKNILDEHLEDEDSARICAAISAYLLNFSRVNNSSTTYHALPDAWQKQFGYNDLYDDVFDMATSMRVGKCFYNTGVNDSDLSSLYVIWSWCGDYWTLGAGSEIGLYKYTLTVSGNKHFDAVSFNIPMSLNSYIVSYDINNTIEPLFHWYPNEPQWWITGFDYSHHDVNAYQIHNIGYLDFSENPNVFESIKKSEFNDNNTYLNESNRLFPNLIFDDIDYYVWLIW